MGKLFEAGINAVIPSQRAIPASLLDPKVKSRSRLHYLMANIEVSRYEGENNWPLLVDHFLSVTESTGANFFVFEDSKLWTSEPENVLNGISREYILLMEDVIEDDFTEDFICESSEAFFTATPFCMLPVTSINGTPIGDGKVGPKYKELLNKWSEDVGIDIKGQIQAWDKGAKEGPSAYKFK
jgi:branched-chain amino acid aminotransferase